MDFQFWFIKANWNRKLFLFLKTRTSQKMKKKIEKAKGRTATIIIFRHWIREITQIFRQDQSVRDSTHFPPPGVDLRYLRVPPRMAESPKRLAQFHRVWQTSVGLGTRLLVYVISEKSAAPETVSSTTYILFKKYICP